MRVGVSICITGSVRLNENDGESAASGPDRFDRSTRSEILAMKIRVKLMVAAALGLLFATGLAYRADAQVGIVTPNPYGADGAYNTFNTGGLQQVRIPPQGVWTEVINVTPKWMVVQNELGQQFPIASDRVRQFLIRWPSSTDLLTQNSVIEVTGPEAGSNVIIADHLDVYENDAQNLVSPAVNNLYGYNRTLSSFDVDQQNSYGVVYWMSPEEYAIPSRMHIVGKSGSVPGGPVRVSGYGGVYYTVQPSVRGMSVTQVTVGSNSYARKGDIAYIVPENIGPRSVDVTQLILYKSLPLRQFQP